MSSLKVTDKRMFTPEGELRAEFRQTREESSPSSPAAGTTPGAAPARESEIVGPTGMPANRAAEQPEDPPPAAADGPSFFNLVELLAEPASIYLEEASRGREPQETVQHLELSRMHIDLLTVLKDKTQGNLGHEEKAVLDDVIYRLRAGYLELRG